jgi:parallel beta-helix repeat protein
MIRTRRFSVFALLLFAASVLVIGRTTAAGATAIQVVHPGQSIQQAIDLASPGDLIVVRPGTYAENLRVATDRLTLLGFGAKLVPPANPTPNECGDSDASGICIVGSLDPNTGAVLDYVTNITVVGFRVSNFPSTGIMALAAKNPLFALNRAVDNGGYGIARFVSTGGEISGNKTSGSAEAGIYVGDSPNANVTVVNNESFGNGEFGFFFRDSAHGKAIGNQAHDNCVGMIVLDTGSGAAHNWDISGNILRRNNAFCPPGDDDTPPLSGTGLLIASGSKVKAVSNEITKNVPAQDVPFAGGVVVISLGGPSPDATGNKVQGNIIQKNSVDIMWDGVGANNVLTPNVCDTSIPPGLCPSGLQSAPAPQPQPVGARG